MMMGGVQLRGMDADEEHDGIASPAAAEMKRKATENSGKGKQWKFW